MGKIVHGNKNFGYAPITKTGNTYAFGTPVMIPGMVSATIEVEQETTNIYADDKVYCQMKGAKVRTAEVVFRNIPGSYAEFLGFKAATNGGYSDTGVFPNHCIFFETAQDDCETGETVPTLHLLYSVKASEPTQESTTDEDEVEAAEITVNYDATESEFVVDADGIAVQYFYIQRTEDNATLYDTFKTAVILPTN